MTDSAHAHELEVPRTRARHARRGVLMAGSLSLIIAVVGAAITGYAIGRQTTNGPVPEATPAPVAAVDCVSDPWPLQSGIWPGPEPAARDLSHDPVPIKGASVTVNNSGGKAKAYDGVTATRAILDFAPVRDLPEIRAGDSVALIEVSADILDLSPWQASDLMIAAYAPDRGHPETIAPRCPLTEPARYSGLLKAMADNGYPPLPDQVLPGEHSTGWVAVAIPSATRALILHLKRHHADGAGAAGEFPLLVRGGAQ